MICVRAARPEHQQVLVTGHGVLAKVKPSITMPWVN